MILLTKRRIVLFAFLLCVAGLQAQNVAICEDGSPPHPSAMLDISSSDKGLLIPTMSLTSSTSPMPVATDAAGIATGLLVFNTGTNMEPGFYYWSGSEWLRFVNEVSMETNMTIKAQYGELWESNDPSAGHTMYLLENQWIGWKTAYQGLCSDSIVADTASQVADKLTILQAGTYEVQVNVSYKGSENAQISGSLFLNGARYPKISFTEKLASNGDLSSAGSGGIVFLDKYDTIDLRMLSSNSFETIEMIYVDLRLRRLGN